MFSRNSTKARAPVAIDKRYSLAINLNIRTDDEDMDGRFIAQTPPTPESVPFEERRAVEATECVDLLFRMSKLRVACPPKWVRLFIAAAKRVEAKLARQRQQMYIAAALDDVEALLRLKDVVPATLFAWWSYELGIVERATRRLRPLQLEVLPPLYGQAFPGFKIIGEKREAIASRPAEGTPEAIKEKQRGDAIIAPLRRALEKLGEIDLKALEDALNDPGCGQWQTAAIGQPQRPATGVNYGARAGEYAGWRPLHFVAALVTAKKTFAAAGQLLLEAQADPMLTDAGGGTALHAAAFRCNLDAVDLLLKIGVPVDVADESGCTALHIGARARHSGIVRRLCSWVVPEDLAIEFIEAEEELKSQRYCPLAAVQLHSEVARGEVKIIKQLVLEGDGNGNELADVNFPDSLGRCPVHTAVSLVSGDNRAADVMRVLAALKANVDARDFTGETPLHTSVRLGRAACVRTLLRLKAHPCQVDNAGRTPLMLAAITPEEQREPPTYDGVLVNKGFRWEAIRDVLEWNGRGKPPGPQPRAFDKPPELSRAGSPTSNEDEEEDEEDEDDEEEDEDGVKKGAYFTEADGITARADAIISLGFDDQQILDGEGRINRGDRIQLSKVLFHHGNVPHDIRLKLLWRKITGPLLRMELQGTLPPRFSGLLHYTLVSVLGKRGACFGILLTANIGTKGDMLPSWDSFAELLKSHHDVADRLEAMRDMGFRGGLPKKTLWVGSSWARDSYPREPEHAPWGQLKYVDQDTAKVINQEDPFVNRRPPEGPLAHEAFKGNVLDVFEPAASEDDAPLPNRGDKLQLANRIFVEEALGMRSVAADRALLIGTKLLCPLLEEAADGVEGIDDAMMAQAAEHQDLLRYVAQQTAPGGKDAPHGALVRSYFNVPWKETRRYIAQALSAAAPPALMQLTAEAEVLMLFPGERGISALTGVNQYDFLPEEDVRWMQLRHSTRAFGVLRQNSALVNANDFNEVVVQLAARFPKSFAESFWFAAYGLLLWGRGSQLKPALASELQFRLRGLSVELNGPRLRPRSDVLAPRPGELTIIKHEANSIGPKPDLYEEMKVHNRWVGWLLDKGGGKIRDIQAQSKCNITVHQDVGHGENFGYTILQIHGETLYRAYARQLLTDCLEEGQKNKDNPPEELGLWGIAKAKTSGGSRKSTAGAPRREAPPPPPPPALPSGLTDMLRAEIVCDDEEALLTAYDAIIGPPPSRPPSRASTVHSREIKSRANSEESQDGTAVKFGVEETHELEVEGTPRSGNDEEDEEPTVSFRAIRVVNGFHRGKKDEVWPRAAGVLVIGCISVVPPDPFSPHLEQLVEVELLLKHTKEARWLADYVSVNPTDEGLFMRIPGTPSGTAPRRRRSVY